MNALRMTTDHLILLIDALSSYKRERAVITTWGAKRLQGTKQTDVVKIGGGEHVDADNLQRELIRELCARNGTPSPILRNNEDLVSESGPYALTRAEQAAEANLRG